MLNVKVKHLALHASSVRPMLSSSLEDKLWILS